MAKQKKPTLPPLSIIYRKIAISFVVLTVLLVGVIAFFSMSKATVAITPKKELRSAEFLVTVKDGTAPIPGTLNGHYEEKVVEDEGQFEATGTVAKSAGRWEGKLTLVNTTTAAQPLVATTRLFSPDSRVLLRMKSGATVPANGKVEVNVYQDGTDPDWGFDIGTQFTFPGLNVAKQKLIYGENTERLSGDTSVQVRVVTADDLEKAKGAIIEKALAKVKEDFAKTPAAALGGVVATTEVQEVIFDAKKGDEKQTFSGKAKIKAELLSYDKAALEKIALEKISANIPSDRELVKFNKDAIIARIKNVNSQTGEAQLAVYADGEVRLNAASPILDPVKIAGMLPDEAKQYLQSFDAIEAVEIRLFPSWQKRIPTIPDRIKIVIKK
ncbi:hypothetical protein A3B21_02000 [Candidatus Uhrbacteria bacterium RIFCSPLOWO2_01_FULL_47_24]|uniref:Baseplate protein J-like domain-containing protein n=1 Tax=Candidatus Uhrbacteria bacterium RIFCSPLOWO2_01_FULL_47_24 TaxID=1802401 RepID=A0A1F7UR24_9BACT|nr:MAG: hypothetical protein A2753_01750 [Candidatus Uhrbacteria bacterium RIFCSPHIGHO2_01_FULL_47_11]OGL67941.1 MAG: hypothetical protein A3D58_05195 [Candidatus Uhrbacteria bacterium RIFCSPHIGHO2_02_FULL_46_47]OGL76430.1 MAG: hypothetical protein A3F52_02835 [Candidatus Uhrbacteria bacterium RIFCSPHIGHO2_12_FULL_47_11]OGL80127.1 MAG: hypothetical protein A3B21_02000 [Candidatus Uhrbacteria bacterium RIFCSPLOWO2_01_FULL_47_24]OGL84912.1 MAG: hypothetical protein A3J03_04380 [Candidatus Uhrbact